MYVIQNTNKVTFLLVTLVGYLLYYKCWQILLVFGTKVGNTWKFQENTRLSVLNEKMTIFLVDYHADYILSFDNVDQYDDMDEIWLKPDIQNDYQAFFTFWNLETRIGGIENPRLPIFKN
jgi:hypothetical protein